MGVEFTASPVALADLARGLLALKGEFDGMEDFIDGYSPAVAHGRVQERLSGFASNWSDKRRDVAKKLEELAGYVDVAAQAYGEVETQLSASFDDATTASGAPDGGEPAGARRISGVG